MKYTVALLLIIVSLGTFAQTKKDVDEEKSSINSAIPARFKGGEEALKKYLIRKTVYPSIALENDVQGEVMVTFVIDRTGAVTNVGVVGKKIGFGLEEEAMRVIQSTSGMWTPASQKGKNVSMRFQIPIRFNVEPAKKKSKSKRRKR